MNFIQKFADKRLKDIAIISVTLFAALLIIKLSHLKIADSLYWWMVILPLTWSYLLYILFLIGYGTINYFRQIFTKND